MKAARLSHNGSRQPSLEGRPAGRPGGRYKGVLKAARQYGGIN